MKYKTNKFSLSEKEQDLRIALVESIRSHVEERGITKEELKKVLDGLEFALDDFRYKEVERTEDEQWEDAVFNIDKDLLGE